MEEKEEIPEKLKTPETTIPSPPGERKRHIISSEEESELPSFELFMWDKPVTSEKENTETEELLHQEKEKDETEERRKRKQEEKLRKEEEKKEKRLRKEKEKKEKHERYKQKKLDELIDLIKKEDAKNLHALLDPIHNGFEYINLLGIPHKKTSYRSGEIHSLEESQSRSIYPLDHAFSTKNIDIIRLVLKGILLFEKKRSDITDQERLVAYQKNKTIELITWLAVTEHDSETLHLLLQIPGIKAAVDLNQLGKILCELCILPDVNGKYKGCLETVLKKSPEVAEHLLRKETYERVENEGLWLREESPQMERITRNYQDYWKVLASLNWENITFLWTLEKKSRVAFQWLDIASNEDVELHDFSSQTLNVLISRVESLPLSCEKKASLLEWCTDKIVTLDRYDERKSLLSKLIAKLIYKDHYSQHTYDPFLAAAPRFRDGILTIISLQIRDAVAKKISEKLLETEWEKVITDIRERKEKEEESLSSSSFVSSSTDNERKSPAIDPYTYIRNGKKKEFQSYLDSLGQEGKTKFFNQSRTCLFYKDKELQPMEWAILFGQHEVVKLLLDYGHPLKDEHLRFENKIHAQKSSAPHDRYDLTHELFKGRILVEKRRDSSLKQEIISSPQL